MPTHSHTTVIPSSLTSTLDIMLGHTCSHMLIVRTCEPIKMLEDALAAGYDVCKNCRVESLTAGGDSAVSTPL